MIVITFSAPALHLHSLAGGQVNVAMSICLDNDFDYTMHGNLGWPHDKNHTLSSLGDDTQPDGDKDKF